MKGHNSPVKEMTNDELFSSWVGAHDLTSLNLPRPSGLFRKGRLLCALPYMRAYWHSEDGRRPSWEEATWKPLEDGFSRFLRADQALEWIMALAIGASGPDGTSFLLKEIRRALRTWLVPVDESLARKSFIQWRRVEAVRVRARGASLFWTRRADRFPDAMRRYVPGLDAVHTPENDRAGLTRYLCEGWGIDDSGQLTAVEEATRWGPSTSRIPHRLHDTPRRLMLAASLQSRAVDLRETDAPLCRQKENGWDPPGKNLRVAFSTFGGLTHEDAVVISSSAAEKLTRNDIYDQTVDIPAAASKVEPVVGEGDIVVQGQILIRAFIDLYALGWRRHEAEDRGAVDGWLEVGLPGSVAPDAGKVIRVSRRTIRTLTRRERVTFTIERRERVNVGDKLSTRHGIKGVVSCVLEDQEMPDAGGAPAEIILSPVGVARRGAMGQFREAGVDPSASSRPGTIFVMRQPQDARRGWSAVGVTRCFIGGEEKDLIRGQRYGEMEFWALMAHGASVIARELLSPARSTAGWMKRESLTEGGGMDAIPTRALNRYLSTVDARIEESRIVRGSFLKSFDMSCRTYPQLRKAWDVLDDADAFVDRGGLGAVSLGRRVTVDIEGRSLAFENFHVLPPWLRPPSKEGRHELTNAYRDLFFDIFMGRDLELALQRCLRIILEAPFGPPVPDDDSIGSGRNYIPTGLGLMRFLRREVLGRRLTRSARAVIVPRPDIKVDEIALPRFIAEVLYEGLSEDRRRLVIVNRNPTLHRKGLLALRPRIEDTDLMVFGIPLGVLQVLGADFDGDQATVVALEREESLTEAESLLPGSDTLRSDTFRPGQPAFPLLHELSSPAEELRLAEDESSSRSDWSRANHKLLDRLIKADPDGWLTARSAADERKDLWEGLDEGRWMQLAEEEMNHVFNTVRMKGQLGGILRRELYRRAYAGERPFYSSVDALQAVTERLVQTALSVKTGKGVATFDARAFFNDPSSGESRDTLSSLDKKLSVEALLPALGDRSEPEGLLRWLALPNCETLLELIENSESVATVVGKRDDPRIAWFL